MHRIPRRTVARVMPRKRIWSFWGRRSGRGSRVGEDDGGLVALEAAQRVEQDLALGVGLVAEAVVVAREAGQAVVGHPLDALEDGALHPPAGEDGDVARREALVEESADEPPGEPGLLGRVLIGGDAHPESG